MNIESARNLSVKRLSLPSAYLLVSHGSRDPRPQASLEQLAQLLGEQAKLAGVMHVQQSHSVNKLATVSVMESRDLVSLEKPLVGTACLELAILPLHRQIQEFGDKAIALGHKQLKVLPLFLLPGVHVMEDIPAEVALAQEIFGTSLKIELQPHLGTHPQLSALLANQQKQLPADAWILLSHGSSRAGAKQPIEAIAKQLGAIAAYWGVPPHLESQVQVLVSAGYQQIGILPYFLFSGGITNAIARAVTQLSSQFPAVSFHLAEPIGVSAELANLVWEQLIVDS